MIKSTIEIRPVSPLDEQVKVLIDKLNTFQIGLYGLDQCSLDSPEEMIANQAYMLGAYEGAHLVAMGAVKLMTDYGEIKRMYVSESQRGSGIASKILLMLEAYVVEQGLTKIRLETGNLHFGAMAMYEKHGYSKIGRFGNYQPNKISVYYEKSWKS